MLSLTLTQKLLEIDGHFGKKDRHADEFLSILTSVFVSTKLQVKFVPVACPAM